MLAAGGNWAAALSAPMDAAHLAPARDGFILITSKQSGPENHSRGPGISDLKAPQFLHATPFRNDSLANDLRKTAMASQEKPS
jgi:hypothetical protein